MSKPSNGISVSDTLNKDTHSLHQTKTTYFAYYTQISVVIVITLYAV